VRQSAGILLAISRPR